MRQLLLCIVLLTACGPGSRQNGNGDGGNGDGNNGCPNACSADLTSVVDCHGNVITQCSATDACDSVSLSCVNACTAAEDDHRSVGCDYYATDMDTILPTYCYAAFVANTWTSPAHISVEYKGASLSPATFTSIPSGSGSAITYGAYDAATGVPPGSVAILFLGGSKGAAPDCPLTPATAAAYLNGTGTGSSFHITTDVPVVAYEMNPYGGGAVAVTGASLLIPTSAWDVNYVAVNVSPYDGGAGVPLMPSLDIVASQNSTTVTLTPVAAVTAGGGVPAGSAGQPMTVSLSQGEYMQITQQAELTGSVVSANNPVGFMAGQNCMRYPIGTAACDHGEQMIPPVKAMGSTYVGVMYRPRTTQETQTFYRVVGAVDGTQLTYSSAVGGPPTLTKGQAVIFQTGTPFSVSSQDASHPFMLFTYMSSADNVDTAGEGYGDPDFVYDIPPAQFLSSYVFFSDPTYPETNLVVVRSKGTDGQFHDVMLDCAGALTGWQPVGAYEWTRADLQTGFAPVGNCNNGRHQITSAAPFGMQVWGWGTPDTGTAYVSYGYPAGMNVSFINSVVIE